MLILGTRVLATVTLVGVSTFGFATATNTESAKPVTFHSSVSSATAGVPIH